MLGLSGSFRACFGLPEKLNLGPENSKSGLNKTVRPPYGLKLSENVDTGPRTPLEALNDQKPLKNAENHNFHDFRPRPPPLPGHARCYMALFVRCGCAVGVPKAAYACQLSVELSLAQITSRVDLHKSEPL